MRQRNRSRVFEPVPDEQVEATKLQGALRSVREQCLRYLNEARTHLDLAGRDDLKDFEKQLAAAATDLDRATVFHEEYLRLEARLVGGERKTA